MLSTAEMGTLCKPNWDAWSSSSENGCGSMTRSRKLSTAGGRHFLQQFANARGVATQGLHVRRRLIG